MGDYFEAVIGGNPSLERFDPPRVDNVAIGSACAVFLVDIDRFKSINDTLGHQAGDRCLRTIGQTITRSIRSHDRAGRSFVLRNIEPFGARDGKELFPELTGLACRAGVHSQACAPPRIELVLFGETKRAQENEKVGFLFTAEEIVALIAHLFSFGASQEVATLGKGGDQGDSADTPLVLCRQEHARITWVNRESEHPSA